MGRKSAKDIKALIEADKLFKAKLDSIGVKVDDFIEASEETKKANLNELYEDWKRRNEGLPDVPDNPPEPDNPPPEPQPNPAGVIYDSNTDGLWANGVSRVVKDKDGNISPNGKGIFTAASGSPEVHIDGQGTAVLVTKPGFGRFYLCVNNFNAQLDFDFNIMDSSVDNMSIKGRSRHQAGGEPAHRFGGLGNATSTTETDFKIEEYHNVHQQGYNKNLPQPLKVGEWYSKRYIYQNTTDDKGIHMEDWIDFKDGKGFVKVFERTEINPIPAAMDKASFDEESWIWMRLNGSGSIAFRNVKVTDLG